MRAGSFPHASSSTIAFPIKIRHEIRRQTPSVKLSAETAFHYGLGLSAYVPVTILQDRYVNLMMQCQVVHDLIHGEVLYARDEIDLIRYRVQEELRQLDRLRHRRERYLILRNLSESTDSLFSAVVLYLRRDGALVELVDFPVKIVVRSLRQVSVGEVIRLRLVGVDLWRARAHLVAT